MERVYVRDDVYQWIPATVVSRDEAGGRVCVRLDCVDPQLKVKQTTVAQNTEEKWFDIQGFEDHTLSMGEAVDSSCGDLALLKEMNEAEILHHLIRRYNHGKEYTRCGELLLVLHPLPQSTPLALSAKTKFFEQDHVGVIQEEKKEETSMEDLEPHVYEVSGKAFRSMRESGKDQAIVVLGEANSGKSTVASRLIDHLVCLSKEPILSRQIVHASTVFEAFGNAKTPWNLNSTRNAKVMSFEFDQVDGTLVGASYRHFLFESTRAVSRSLSERNFNVFYQILAASPGVKATVLGDDWAGAMAEDFSYLISSESPVGNIVGNWEKTSQALLVFGWEGESLQHLMQGTSIVLLLGNVTFAEHDETASIQSRADLNMLAISLGVPIEDLEEAMTERQVTTADGDFAASQTQIEAAKDLCDSLAKAIYECLFASICRQINILTSAPPITSGRPNRINLVDMFGFDCRENNGLGQMLVNYANERMQMKYVVECFREKRSLLRERNGSIPQFDSLDNADTVALFESPTGILRAVIENAKNGLQPNASRMANESGNISLSVSLDRKSKFFIRHFAETVEYDGSLLYSDRLPRRIPGRLLRILSYSKNPILSQEFSRLLSGHEHAIKRVIKRRSVTEIFHRELRDLLVQLKSSKLHFVRCMKMTREKLATVDYSLVAKQIRYSGLLPSAASPGILLNICEREQVTREARAALILTRWAAPRTARLLSDHTIATAATTITSWFRSQRLTRRYKAQKAAASVIAGYVKSRFKEKPNEATLENAGDPEPSRVDSPCELHEPLLCPPKAAIPPQPIEAASTQASNEEKNRSLILLVEQLQQNITHAEMHNQDMEIEYEERLGEYEREVLDLRQQLSVFKSEKAALKGEVEASAGNVESLKEGIRALQESHKGYLEKVMRAVEKANAEHSKSLETIKRTRDSRISQLQAEIDSLRQRQKVFDIHPHAKREKINRLARRLEKVLSPTFIADQLSIRNIDVGMIEERVSSKARNLLYRLEDICTAPQLNTGCTNEMQRQLASALQEIQTLQSELSRRNPTDPVVCVPRKRRGTKKIVSRSTDV